MNVFDFAVFMAAEEAKAKTGRPVIIKNVDGWVEVGHLEPCHSLTKDEDGNDVYEHTVNIDPVASRAYRAQLAAE